MSESTQKKQVQLQEENIKKNDYDYNYYTICFIDFRVSTVRVEGLAALGGGCWNGPSCRSDDTESVSVGQVLSTGVLVVLVLASPSSIVLFCFFDFFDCCL